MGLAGGRGRIFVFLAMVLAGLAALGQEPATRDHWSAQWISHPTAPLREPITLHFKKSFDLAAAPAHFVVHVSADNRFILYVNGERVGDGPARGDLAHWRYETFDLGQMLRPGANVLAATVWNFGIYSPVAQISDRTAFLVEGDTAAEAVVNTDKSWMVEVEPGQTPLPRTLANNFWAYVAVGWGETLRAADFDWKWMDAGTEGSHWVAAGKALREVIYPQAGTAATHGVTADVPWALVADTLPPMAYRPEDPGHLVRRTDGADSALIADAISEHSFPVHPVTIKPHSQVHLMLDRGEETTAFPRLTFSGGRGAHITLTYAEALFDKQQHKGNRNEVGDRQAIGIQDEIYPDGGKDRVFEPLWWRTWRYVDVSVETGDEPLNLDALDVHFTGYPFKIAASFSSSDPELQKIWEIGWHTVELDGHETYSDCPYYEQLQYVGDTRLEELITYAVTGDDRLPRQAIRAFDESRIPEGITASRYPSALPQYIPTFSLLWVGMVHDNYMYRPDKEFVRGMLPGTRTVLDWFAKYQHEDGLLAKLPWWSFIDWVGTQTKKDFPSYDANNESCLTTMQYIGALEDAIDLETALGSREIAGTYGGRLERAKTGVKTQCWDAAKQLFADNAAKDMYSQHTNMLAVLYDVVPTAEQAALMRRVEAKELGGTNGWGDATPLIGASYYFRYYLARALDHAGMADEYLKTLGDWHGFLKMGFTTWPEEPGDTRSDAHAWTSHPTFDLLTLVAGISPAEPGFKTVRIAPHLGDLKHLEASYPHPLGLIRVKYEGSSGTVELPSGLAGTFVWKGREIGLHEGSNSVSLK